MFRRILNLEAFFQDHRKLCYLLIDVNKYKSIQDVENHITVSFCIDQCIYLSENDVWLPSFADISILTPTLSSDVIKVKPLHPANLLTDTNLNEIPVVNNLNSNGIHLKTDNEFCGSNNKSKEKKRKEKKRKNCDDVSLQNGNSNTLIETCVVDVNESNTTVEHKKIKREKKQKDRNVFVDDDDEIEIVDSLNTLNVNCNTLQYNSNINNNSKNVNSSCSHLKSSLSDNVESDCIYNNANNANKNRNCEMDFIKTDCTRDENSLKTEDSIGNISESIVANKISDDKLNCNNTDVDNACLSTRKRRHRRHRKKKSSLPCTDQQEVISEQPEVSNSSVTVKFKFNDSNIHPIHIRFDDTEEEDNALRNSKTKLCQKNQYDNVPDSLKTVEQVSCIATLSSVIHSGNSGINDEPVNSYNNSEIIICDSDSFKKEEHRTVSNDEVNQNNINGTSCNGVQNKLDNSDPIWVTELMKMKEISQSDKPPVFCRNPKVNATDHEIQNNVNAVSHSSQSKSKLHDNNIDHNALMEIMNNSRKIKSDLSEDSSTVDHTLQVDDIVDFKILFLSQDYTPTLSDSIIGRVIKVSDTLIKLKILYGKEICKPLNGKFSVIDNSQENENIETEEKHDSDVVELFMKDLITPRKVINPFEMFSSSPVASKS